jgi:hypothetical protein
MMEFIVDVLPSPSAGPTFDTQGKYPLYIDPDRGDAITVDVQSGAFKIPMFEDMKGVLCKVGKLAVLGHNLKYKYFVVVYNHDKTLVGAAIL